MLGFFESEMDSRLPVSAAPPDHKLSHFLDFTWESTVPMMQNDSFFTSFSSPIRGTFGNNESRVKSSNVPLELERLSQDCDFHLESFSPPLPPPTPTPGISTTAISYLPGGGDAWMTDAAAYASQTKIPNRIHKTMAADERKETIAVTGDPIGKLQSSGKESKRRKTTYSEKLHHPPSVESTTSQLMKAPMKRAQKLGDKITALQQLVSPFGKTDTASVLHEATICIKVLQEQIQVLTNPYLGMKPSPLLQDHGAERADLRSRGLCLVPVSPTIINLTNQAAFSDCTPNRTGRGTGSDLL